MQVNHQQNAQDEPSDSDNSAETASRSRNNSNACSDNDQLQDSNLNSSSHDSHSMYIHETRFLENISHRETYVRVTCAKQTEIETKYIMSLH